MAASADVILMACRVFIADDVEALRSLWREFLEADPDIEVVGEAADGLTALEGMHVTRPDVVVLDLSMPELDGLEVIRRLQVELPEVRIVVVTGFSAGRLAPLALELGATSYLEKGMPAETLREAVLSAYETVR